MSRFPPLWQHDRGNCPVRLVPGLPVFSSTAGQAFQPLRNLPRFAGNIQGTSLVKSASLPRTIAIIAVVALPLALAGCKHQSKLRQPRQRDFSRYGKLSGLRRVTNPRLRDELARLEQEGATPEQLSRVELPEADNAAAVIRQLFPAKKLADLAAQSEAFLPEPGKPLEGIALERASQFYDEHRAAVERARDALRRRRCELHVDYMQGFAADLSSIDDIVIDVRLESFKAAEHLAANDPEAAVEPLSFMFQLIECLANVKLVEARLQAAFLRSEALETIHWTATHPAATRDLHDRLFELVQEQLANWPDDAWAWIGDRAVGLHAYEVIRDGKIRWLLNDEEIAMLNDEQILSQLNHPDSKVLAADELYYLDTMRGMIDVCSQPYFKRRQFFETLRRDLQRRRNDQDFPLVAARILLKDVENGHIIQARDRTLCEAWSIALAVAAGRPSPGYEVNPLSGERYRVVITDDQVAVWNIGNGEPGDEYPVIVPYHRKRP